MDAKRGFALLILLALQCSGLHAELLVDKAAPSLSQSRQGGSPAAAEEVSVVLAGEITRGDVDAAFRLAREIESGRQRLAGNAVWLASPGGDIDSAMKLGRLWRQLGVTTHIGKNDRCLSACVFAFMGGERRVVDGQLGIHRPYFNTTEDTPDRTARFRFMQKVVRDYVEEMDFPPSLYEAVMRVPPESMRVLAPAELKNFYLEGISPSTEDILDAAAARRLGVPMVEYLRRKAAASTGASGGTLGAHR